MKVKHINKTESAPVQVAQHTSTPWQVAYYGEEEKPFIQVGPLKIASIIYQDDGNSNTITHANAKFIVLACNCHDQLVEVLKAVARLDYLHEHNALAKQVRDALAKAQGK